ncbi:phosphoribosyl-ATP diphosphatase [Neomegalonema sp.]|uniref:phosphoribosyl-ATP diphosphatase n=1 Tax=Neomegalonema sp. TaxID=2039713 RepID=UPI00260213E7|nr:phosphoribosyl-ATP diphosphatase [Neomegalonema sp.]MDD2869142.1 phosphoribosyl-ATP diphosphatase [Neomegalonema sp.]
MSESALDRLEARIRARAAAGEAEKSYTASLLAKGPAACAQKLGEEAVETVIAALQDDPQALVSESADLLYHWLVLLQARGVGMAQVFAELDRREGLSGLAEKASRAH